MSEMTLSTILETLAAEASSDVKAKMVRAGLAPEQVLGVRVPQLRALGKRIGRDHELALQLWDEGLRETRILASLVADPDQVTEELADSWVAAITNWEVCDQACMNLFEKTTFAYEKAEAWTEREELFVKRAGFAVIAHSAVSDKKREDAHWLQYLPIIEREADDKRALVKKAVDWALRSIGKRCRVLNEAALAAARRLEAREEPAARWIGRKARRELESERVQKRIAKRTARISHR